MSLNALTRRKSNTTRRRKRKKTPHNIIIDHNNTSSSRCCIINNFIALIITTLLLPFAPAIPKVSSFVLNPISSIASISRSSGRRHRHNRRRMLLRLKNPHKNNHLAVAKRIIFSLQSSPFGRGTLLISSSNPKIGNSNNNPKTISSSSSYYLSSSTSSLRLFSSSSSNNNNDNNFVVNSNNTTSIMSPTPENYNSKDDDEEVYDSDDNVAMVEDNDNDDDDIMDDYRNLPKGSIDGFYVVKIMETPYEGFDMESIRSVISDGDIQRTKINPTNITVPVALMILDPEEYPSLSSSRKACRRQQIMLHRGPINNNNSNNTEAVFQYENCKTAKVGDRIYPGDVLAKQTRMADGGYYYTTMFYEKPPFDLPVVYEDDHFAIINKPAGIVVYAHKKGGHGTMTVMAGLPFAVQPPKAGTYSTMRLPRAVHRLDKPTSGLLVAAKTKPAMVHLSLQFRDRKVKKTYVAIVNGIPPESPENTISSQEAYELGVDVDPNDTSTKWQLIDYPLDEKSATTIWRSIKYSKSLKADDNYLTMVELKPKSGRFHQLRRHMAWVCERPIIGDHEYDGGRPDAINLRERGLFLCSNRITLEHPFYNTDSGRKVYNQLSESKKEELRQKGVTLVPVDDSLSPSSSNEDEENSCHNSSNNGKVMLSVEIDIPSKFNSFLDHENSRYERLSSTSPTTVSESSVEEE